MMTPDNMCRLSGVVIMRNNRWIMAVGLLSLWVAPSYGDALRCNNQVVREGDSKAEVLAACGQPVLKESNCGVGGKNKKGACRQPPIYSSNGVSWWRLIMANGCNNGVVSVHSEKEYNAPI
ncbi:MAG: hypothetical protein FD130_1272 [Halothiobacillaceae bacterium]|nr:MAG: hypothetical protein FD130_1272 [Halothiobacillaceae bacterium]